LKRLEEMSDYKKLEEFEEVRWCWRFLWELKDVRRG